MLREIIIAIQSYFRAHRFISKHKLWKWIIVPGIIYTILFIVGIYLFITSSNYFVRMALTESGVNNWLQQQNASIINFLFLFGQLIIQLVLLLFYFSWFKYFFLVIGSPIFAYLSEKTEAIVTKKDFPFSWRRFFIDVIRGIRIAIRNAMWQTIFTISILIIAIIPVTGWFTPLLSLIIECYYLGFSMLDYTNERRGHSVRYSIHFVNKHRGLAIGNGMIFYAMHALPVVGWIFAPGYAVIAATLSLQQKEKAA